MAGRKGASGRIPKPTALHKLQGTYNVTRHRRRRAAEPMPEGDLDAPPDDLNPEMRANWEYAIANAPKGLLKLIDRAILKIWVDAEYRHDDARRMLDEINRSTKLRGLIKGPGGIPIVSPYNDILKETARTMFRAVAELGFSPASRPRIRLEKPEEEQVNRWGKFAVISGGKPSD